MTTEVAVLINEWGKLGVIQWNFLIACELRDGQRILLQLQVVNLNAFLAIN